jgi:hypothetical protein
MAKDVKKLTRSFIFLFRLVGFVLIFTMLLPVMKVFHRGNGNGNGHSRKKFQETLSDSLFAPLVEKISNKSVWAIHT